MVSEDITEKQYLDIMVFFSCYSMTIIVAGLVGNILALAVMIVDKQLRLSTRLYYSFLALTDSLALLTGMVRYWVQTAMSSRDVRNDSEIACKLHTYLTYLSQDLSAWLLCTLSVERFVLVAWPTLGRTNPKRHRNTALVVCAVLFVIINIKDFSMLARLYERSRKNWYCATLPVDYFIEDKTFQFIDVIIGAIALLVLIGSSIGILILLKRQFRRVGVSSSSMQERSALLATKMLLAISILQMVTAMPASIYLILNLFPETKVTDLIPYYLERITYYGVMIASLSNCGSRFYLYLLSSPRFRNIIVGFFKCKKVIE